jgi:6-phosphogluconate dehydrogenase
MNKQNIGIIGLGVMGKNLALNMESKGFSVAVYDAWEEKVIELKEPFNGKKIALTYSLKEFTDALEIPRKILLMVKAGDVTDNTIHQLKPFLLKGDILIDGGNSFFMDTIRRNNELETEGLRFIGTGVSGGEEGALKGPAIMPGGQMDAFQLVEPVFNAIAAKVNGEPCCTYIGTDGAGHYVKMVHNGIEYADMQLICEAYALLKNIAGFSNKELSALFGEWNRGELDSYLVEITGDILSKNDPETGKAMVDVILDKAGQKGTGIWTSQNALLLGVAAPSIAEAVFARCLAAIKEERVKASKVLKGPDLKFNGDKMAFAESVRKALYAGKVCCYAQGFALMRAASKEYKWNLDYGKIASIFRGGCIIRAKFLNKITESYREHPETPNLMLTPYFSDILEKYQVDLRFMIAEAVKSGVPVPAFSSALSYFDGYRSEDLPANLLQAQRDYFGAHTFERKDREGVFHFNWY